MAYPMRQPEYTKGKVDPKTGGSFTRVPDKEPDFGNFTKEHWELYNKEKLIKENDKLKGIISFIVVVALVFLAVRFGRYS